MVKNLFPREQTFDYELFVLLRERSDRSLGYQGRDIEAVLINPEQYLIASCDSCGAIGLKEFDVVKVSWSVTGRMTTRVALLEVLAVGAVPKIMTVAISNEPSPTGEELLKGVKEELDFAGLNLSMAVSTEKIYRPNKLGSA